MIAAGNGAYVAIVYESYGRVVECAYYTGAAKSSGTAQGYVKTSLGYVW